MSESCYVCGRGCLSDVVTPTVKDGLQPMCSDQCITIAQQGDFDAERRLGHDFKMNINRRKSYGETS